MGSDIQTVATPSRLLRPRELRALLGVSGTTLWRMTKRGSFPAPIRISPGCVGWRADDVQAWLAQRAAESK